MKRNILLGLLALWGFVLAGCGNGSGPSGPGNYAIFSLTAQPSEITPPENAQLYLTATAPNEFNALSGQVVLFTSASADGFFNYDTSRVDLQAVSLLNPEVWFQYSGPGGNLVDTVYAHCLSAYGDTLAWNYCTITIVGNQ